MTEMEERRITSLFNALHDFATRRGLTNLKDVPGCAKLEGAEPDGNRRQVIVYFNGHKTPQPAHDDPPTMVEPFGFVVFVNDWPAAVGNPFGGACMGGTEQDLLSLIEALP